MVVIRRTTMLCYFAKNTMQYGYSRMKLPRGRRDSSSRGTKKWFARQYVFKIEAVLHQYNKHLCKYFLTNLLIKTQCYTMQYWPSFDFFCDYWSKCHIFFLFFASTQNVILSIFKILLQLSAFFV